MDAFALAVSYGIKKISIKKIVITSICVGTFHFFMPLIGNEVGIFLFKYTFLKPKFIIFLVFMLLSVDMLISFFNGDGNIKELNIIGILFFSLSVSLDSFSVGLGLNYLYSNVLFSCSCFSLISTLMTMIGFKIGKYINDRVGKYSFLVGSLVIFLYAIWVLTK